MTITAPPSALGADGWADELVTETRVDRTVFSSPAIAEREQRRIFQKGWVYVGLEAEVPNPGDYRTTWMGDVPVVLVRGRDGQVNVLENACGHRGAMVALGDTGSCTKFECLYHRWTFALDGRLLGVPGQVNYKCGLEKSEHGMRRFRTETFAGLVFASAEPEVAGLADYFGRAADRLDGILRGGALVIVGYQRFRIRANWKLFFENTQDAYHALLLHKFVDALSVIADGDNIAFENGHGVIEWPIPNVTADMLHAYIEQRAKFKMRDVSMFVHGDWKPGTMNRVMGLFPNALVLELWDMINVRQLIPRGPDVAELHTVALGVAGESPERLATRARAFTNYFGPAGFVGRDDVVSCEATQESFAAVDRTTSLMALGDLGSPRGDLNGEATVRNFWRAYSERMGDATNGERG
ncbi:MAG: Rieske 2Fe-2S domain-containing protein [Actinobacteria bacterium]|nr:Rieske 2Fe-2S domain-containing protein [Actinomycetota bacterium]